MHQGGRSRQAFDEFGHHGRQDAVLYALLEAPATVAIRGEAGRGDPAMPRGMRTSASAPRRFWERLLDDHCEFEAQRPSAYLLKCRNAPGLNFGVGTGGSSSTYRLRKYDDECKQHCQHAKGGLLQ